MTEDEERRSSLMKKNLVGKLRTIADEYSGVSIEHTALHTAANRLELHDRIAEQVRDLGRTLERSGAR